MKADADGKPGAKAANDPFDRLAQAVRLDPNALFFVAFQTSHQPNFLGLIRRCCGSIGDMFKNRAIVFILKKTDD